jgi:hypothetical protein
MGVWLCAVDLRARMSIRRSAAPWSWRYLTRSARAARLRSGSARPRGCSRTGRVGGADPPAPPPAASRLAGGCSERVRRREPSGLHGRVCVQLAHMGRTRATIRSSRRPPSCRGRGSYAARRRRSPAPSSPRRGRSGRLAEFAVDVTHGGPRQKQLPARVGRRRDAAAARPRTAICPRSSHRTRWTAAARAGPSEHWLEERRCLLSARRLLSSSSLTCSCSPRRGSPNF